MAKYIVKTDRGNKKFRLIVPRKIILGKGWLNVSHVTIEDHWGDRLVIRRLMTDEDTKTKDN